MFMCNRHATNAILQVPSEDLALFTPITGRSLPPGVELAISDFPSANATNYAKEKLAIQ